MFIGATNRLYYGKLHDTLLPKNADITVNKSEDNNDFTVQVNVPMFVLPMSKRVYIWSKHMDSKKF